MVQLNDHFTYKKLFKAVIPSVAMMVFISIYSIIDGLFVSNFVGTTAFAGLNLIYPVLMIVGAIGFMIGTGVGSALAIAAIGAAYSLGLLGAAASSKPVVASSNNGNNDKDKDENQDNNDNAA